MGRGFDTNGGRKEEPQKGRLQFFQPDAVFHLAGLNAGEEEGVQ